MAAGYRGIGPLGASTPHAVTQVGVRGLLAFWIGGGGAAAVVTPPVAAPVQPGWIRERRRSREYEDYLRALAEGRKYVPPGAEDAPPAKRPKRRKPQREPTFPTFPAYTGRFLDDLADRHGLVELDGDALLADWLAAYAVARQAYVLAELAGIEAERRRRDEEDVLILLLAA